MAKTFSHKGLAEDVVCVSWWNRKPEQDVIIHITGEVWKNEHNDTFWKTRCGRYITDVYRFPIDEIIALARSGRDDVYLCPSCAGTLDEYLSVKREFMEQRRLRDEERERKDAAEHEERKRKWDSMVSVIKAEVGWLSVKTNKELSVNPNDETEYHYTVVRGGVPYKITISISEEERE